MEEDELELEYEDSSDDDNGRNISSKGWEEKKNVEVTDDNLDQIYGMV